MQIILISIVSIIALVLLLALIMQKDYSLSSEITINRSQKDVFDYVKHIKNQSYYNKWVMADPNSKMEYKGTDGTVGFISSWNSEVKNVGVGEQEIIKINEGVGYDTELRFEKPFKGISYTNTTTKAVSDNQTKVITTFNSRTPFPMNLMVQMLKNMLQKDLNENMANLKNVLEVK